eukprot:s3559_g8.t1
MLKVRILYRNKSAMPGWLLTCLVAQSNQQMAAPAGPDVASRATPSPGLTRPPRLGCCCPRCLHPTTPPPNHRNPKRSGDASATPAPHGLP